MTTHNNGTTDSNRDVTTARAQRLRDVASGAETDAVDRTSPRSNPGGSVREGTPRSRQMDRRDEVASEVDVDRAGVGAIDRLGRGVDPFLRSSGVDQFGDRVASEFADEADFVTTDDVDPSVDARRITATPTVAQGRRSAVADRAREQSAAGAEFIRRDDLTADVGAFGVESVAVAEGRRDAVADRTASQLAADDPFAEADDFGVEVSERGVEEAALTDPGARRRAGRQFESEFDAFGGGDLDPDSDIRELEDGFGLARGPAREAAAADLDSQFADEDIGPEDIELTRGSDGTFEAAFEREVSR